MSSDLSEYISGQVDFLSKSQGKDGSFCSTSFCAGKYSKVNSPFVTSLILISLSHIESARAINKKTANYLLTQKSQHCSFNYWARSSVNFNRDHYPDDLDDTFCALSAIHSCGQSAIGGSDLAKAISLLTLNEISEGGPYKTWLVPEKIKDTRWHDIDLAVNANIAYFLKLNNVQLPNLEEFFNKSILDNLVISPYYCGFAPVFYFLSRAYSGVYQQKLIQQAQEQYQAAKNPLDRLLILNGLFNLERRNIKEARKVLKEDISQFCPFVREKVSENEECLAGSADLNCALAIELANKILLLDNNTSMEIISFQKTFEKRVVAKSAKYLSSFGNQEFSKYLQAVIEYDKNGEIILMPYVFWSMLTGKNNTSMEEVEDLSLANLYGWTAYSIYDDFYDDEGKKEYLPLANILLRQFSIFFSSHFTNKRFKKRCLELLDEIELSNLREIKYYRIDPDKPIISYKRYQSVLEIAGKSIGHFIPALAIFCRNNATESDTKNLESFYRNYIAARQLCDDMHDWKRDLQNGHITFVVSALLQEYGKKSIRLSPKTLELLKNLYWRKTIVNICKSLEKCLHEAEKSLEKIEILEDKKKTLNILTPFYQTLKETREQQKGAIEFISHFAKSEDKLINADD